MRVCEAFNFLKKRSWTRILAPRIFEFFFFAEKNLHQYKSFITFFTSPLVDAATFRLTFCPFPDRVKPRFDLLRFPASQAKHQLSELPCSDIWHKPREELPISNIHDRTDGHNTANERIIPTGPGGNMNRYVCLVPMMLAGALILSGCNGGSAAAANTDVSAALPTGPSPAQQLAQLESDGKLPKLNRSDSVAGPDADGNGVRDDIDAYLRQRFSDVAQRAAATQMAKAMQSAVTAAGGSADASQAASRQIFDAVKCLHIRFHGLEGENSPGSVRLEIESFTTNTKARLLAYIAYNKSRDGTASSLSEGDTCE